MSFLQKPLYLSSLTVLLNLPPSAVLMQQAALQQTALQQTAQQQTAQQQTALLHTAQQRTALQTVPQQTAAQQPALHWHAGHGDISTDGLRAVQTAVQWAVAGGCASTLLCCPPAQC